MIDPQDEETGKLAVQRGAQDYVFKDHLENHLLLKALRSMIERAACSEALFEEKERACVTLNSIGDAVVSTDVSCQITYLNATAEDLTGWTQDEAVGHPIEDVIKFVDATTRRCAKSHGAGDSRRQSGGADPELRASSTRRHGSLCRRFRRTHP